MRRDHQLRSQNLRMVGLEGMLKIIQFQPPAEGSIAAQQITVLDPPGEHSISLQTGRCKVITQPWAGSMPRSSESQAVPGKLLEQGWYLCPVSQALQQVSTGWQLAGSGSPLPWLLLLCSACSTSSGCCRAVGRCHPTQLSQLCQEVCPHLPRGFPAAWVGISLPSPSISK